MKLSVDNTSDHKVYYDGIDHILPIDYHSSAKDLDYKYSTDGINYDLNIIPSYKEIGNYKVYYKISKIGLNEYKNSKYIKIYGIKSLNNNITIKNNSILRNNNNYDEMLNLISINSETSKIKHYNVSNVEVNDDIYKTGDILKIILNDDKEYNYTLSYLGDVNGDGKVSSADYIKIRNHIMDKERIIKDSVYYMASDVNKDNIISSADYINIRKYIMNGEAL